MNRASSSRPRREEDIWFARGRPVRRKGWLALAAYGAGVLLLGLGTAPLGLVSPLLLPLPLAGILLLTLWFVRLCARHGGSRKRGSESSAEP